MLWEYQYPKIEYSHNDAADKWEHSSSVPKHAGKVPGMSYKGPQTDGHLLNPQQFLNRDCYTPSGKRAITFISVNYQYNMLTQSTIGDSGVGDSGGSVHESQTNKTQFILIYPN